MLIVNAIDDRFHITLQGGSLLVSKTTFIGNMRNSIESWDIKRSAIVATEFLSLQIENSTFVNNSALYGAAIFCEVQALISTILIL